MSFYVKLNHYQVETENSFDIFPDQREALDHYQQFVNKQVPVEFYREGVKEKEYKPA